MKQKTLPYTFRHELNDVILKLCHSQELPLHQNNKGPKIFTEYQKITLIILFRRSKKPLRQFVNELPESKWIDWLGLRRIPSKSVLHNWLLEIPLELIRLFNQIILEKENPSLMAIDATGIDSWQRSRHYERRIFEDKPHMPYAKLDSLIDTETMLIHDFVLRIKPRHDTIGAKTIFKRIRYKGIKILGDKGYDSEKLHNIAFSKSNVFYAPVRKFSRKKPKGRHRKRCSEGDEDYSRRNTVESSFHALKFTRVSCLKSKKHFMKKREMAWCILVYNIEILNKRICLTVLVAYATFLDRPKN